MYFIQKENNLLISSSSTQKLAKSCSCSETTSEAFPAFAVKLLLSIISSKINLCWHCSEQDILLVVAKHHLQWILPSTQGPLWLVSAKRLKMDNIDWSYEFQKLMTLAATFFLIHDSKYSSISKIKWPHLERNGIIIGMLWGEICSSQMPTAAFW